MHGSSHASTAVNLSPIILAWFRSLQELTREMVQEICENVMAGGVASHMASKYRSKGNSTIHAIRAFLQAIF